MNCWFMKISETDSKWTKGHMHSTGDHNIRFVDSKDVSIIYISKPEVIFGYGASITVYGYGEPKYDALNKVYFSEWVNVSVSITEPENAS